MVHLKIHYLLSIIFSFFLSCNEVLAQREVTIKSFTQTTDHIPGNDRRNDLNGVPCALIKVYVVDDIDRVEGNKIGDIVKRGNVEKWVYMCKGSRNIRLHLRNHLPIRVIFQDYHINGLESNRVYELVIETDDETASTSQIKKQMFVLNYSPANATVLIDSKLYKGNGRIETNLPIGEHSYTIAAEGYATTEGIVKINEHARREITENLIAENNTEYNPHENGLNNSFNENEYSHSTPSPGSTSWSPTNYTKSMLKGEGAFLYNGLYYIVISHERKTVAVVKPTKIEYNELSYVIPSHVQNGNEMYTVTEIAPSAFTKSKNLSNIILPETIEAIGEMAFAFCRELAQFSFPSNLRYVGRMAFFNDEITDIILPNSIEEIAEEAFLTCKKRMIIGHTDMGRLYVPNTIKTIGKHAFASIKNSYRIYWTAKFDIQNLPTWVTQEVAKKIGIHEDSYSYYIQKSK